MDELDYRQKQRITKLTNTAGFPQRYKFDQFRDDEVAFQTGVDLQALKSLEFYHERKNLIMYGGTGTGKTMLSICLGLEACKADQLGELDLVIKIPEELLDLFEIYEKDSQPVIWDEELPFKRNH